MSTIDRYMMQARTEPFPWKSLAFLAGAFTLAGVSGTALYNSGAKSGRAEGRREMQKAAVTFLMNQAAIYKSSAYHSMQEAGALESSARTILESFPETFIQDHRNLSGEATRLYSSEQDKEPEAE